jgi:hypothetical protein
MAVNGFVITKLSIDIASIDSVAQIKTRDPFT